MIQAQAGHTFDAVLEGAPSGLEGTIGVRIVDPTTESTPVARTTAGITEFPSGSGVYGVTLTAPALGGNTSPWPISVLWDTGEPLEPDGVFTEDLVVYAGLVPSTPSATFCTAADITARVGRTLTTAETTMADGLAEAATMVIADAVGRDADWATNLDPVPPMLRYLAIELAARTLGNPQALAALSEQLGAYQYSQRFRDGGGGGDLMLTKTEELLARRVVYGRTSGSTRVDSTATEVYDQRYGS